MLRFVWLLTAYTCSALLTLNPPRAPVARHLRPASVRLKAEEAEGEEDPEVVFDVDVIVDEIPDPARRARLKQYYREELGGDADAEDAKKLSLVARVGESGALAYVGINVVWYSVGVNVFLHGLPLPKTAVGGSARLALKRFATAWGLCFVASQWSAGLRAGLAAALSPSTARLLSALRRRLPKAAPRWLAPALSLSLLVSCFVANAAAILVRELVRLAVAP